MDPRLSFFHCLIFNKLIIYLHSESMSYAQSITCGKASPYLLLKYGAKHKELAVNFVQSEPVSISNSETGARA